MPSPKLSCVIQVHKHSLACNIKPVKVVDEERKEMSIPIFGPPMKIVDVRYDFLEAKPRRLQRWLSKDRHMFVKPDIESPCVLITEPTPDDKNNIYATEHCTLHVLLCTEDTFVLSYSVVVSDEQPIELTAMKPFGIESIQLHQLTTSTDTKLFRVGGIKLSSNANINDFAVGEYIQWYY